MTKKQQCWMVTSIVFLLIVIDQWIKIYVKTHFALHECYDVTSWFKLLFIENNGMAFGMEFGAKQFLTFFRLFACAALIYYIGRIIRHGAKVGYLVVLSLILAGAMGNIVDCVFYGQIFDSPVFEPARFVPFGSGYAPLFEGRVVDMFYFPLVEWNWPDWLPVVGGDHFIFFSPIFNFADSCITCGMAAFILFYHNVLMEAESSKH